MNSGQVRIDVCIPSIGRPSLVRAIQSIADCELPSNFLVRVIVADDSCTGAVSTLLAQFDVARVGPPVLVVQSNAKNIASARNACLHAADADYVALMDDDEWAANDWLTKLVAQAVSSGADAIFGRVVPVFPDGTPSWVAQAAFSRDDGAHGSRVTSGRSGNVLVRLALIRKYRLLFSEKYGRTGGEDTDFFRRLGAQGALMVVSNSAKVFEHVPQARTKLRYLVGRHIRAGQVYATQAMEDAGFLRRFTFAAAAFCKMLVYVVAGIVAVPISRGTAFGYILRSALNLGKVRFSIGLATPMGY